MVNSKRGFRTYALLAIAGARYIQCGKVSPKVRVEYYIEYLQSAGGGIKLVLAQASALQANENL